MTTAPGEWLEFVGGAGYAVVEGRTTAAGRVRVFTVVPSDPRDGGRAGVVVCGERAFCSCRGRECGHAAAVESILRGEQG